MELERGLSKQTVGIRTPSKPNWRHMNCALCGSPSSSSLSSFYLCLFTNNRQGHLNWNHIPFLELIRFPLACDFLFENVINLRMTIRWRWRHREVIQNACFIAINQQLNSSFAQQAGDRSSITLLSYFTGCLCPPPPRPINCSGV